MSALLVSLNFDKELEILNLELKWKQTCLCWTPNHSLYCILPYIVIGGLAPIYPAMQVWRRWIQCTADLAIQVTGPVRPHRKAKWQVNTLVNNNYKLCLMPFAWGLRECTHRNIARPVLSSLRKNEIRQRYIQPSNQQIVYHENSIDQYDISCSSQWCKTSKCFSVFYLIASSISLPLIWTVKY